MQEKANLWLAAVTTIIVVTFPFPYNAFSFHTKFIVWFFEPVCSSIAEFLHLNPVLRDLSSDSKALYVFIAVLMIFSLVIILPNRFKSFYERIGLIRHSKTIVAFFLSLILLKYGFDKLFKQQFYLPEPNLLYTPLGELDKDILYWSTMGVSYSYNLFLGIAELIPAILLLRKKTRELGALLAVFVLMNVFVINLSFDISVKLFSFILLCLSLYLAMPLINRIILLLQNKNTVIKDESNAETKRQFPFRYLIISIIFFEALYPYFRSNNFNDDVATRPTLHGAYEVIESDFENSGNGMRLKRIFFHRDSYFIFQNESDEFFDFQMQLDPIDKLIVLDPGKTNELILSFEFNKKTNELNLTDTESGRIIRCVKLKTEDLPLMKPLFHFSVD